MPIFPLTEKPINRDASNEAGLTEGVAAILVIIAVAAFALRDTIQATLDQAERRYIRGEKLAAYRRRRDWKKSDLSNLKTLDLSPAAQRRMACLSGTGRPVVTAHRPLEVAIVEKLGGIQPLFDPAASVTERKRALKRWPYWEHHVEALYRGEWELAKQGGIRSPADYAERLVATELGLSTSTVHAICGRIRHKRSDWDGAANFPSMTLSEYEAWMSSGRLPDQ